MIKKLINQKHVIPISILCLLNISVFYNYWIGYSTPPWDFLGGGQVEQFRFYEDGSFFNPPSWFPYAWFGIPEYQLLQDGGWFAPVAFVAEFFTWSPPNAARVQAFIILFGSIGTYLLSTRFFNIMQISLLSGLLYTFIPVFYSNAQHYSVVRAAAFLPWLLYIFHKESILKSKVIPFFGIFIVFQSIVGSYPGNLISMFYTTLIFIVYQIFTISKNKSQYLILVLIISTSSGLMGMIRYLPTIANLSSFPSEVGNQAGIDFNNLVYLIYPFIGENLPWADPTLRSIFVGPIVVSLLFFVNVRDRNLLIWLILSFISILFMMQNKLNEFIRTIVPLADISRFGISDWRNTFNLSLILITCFTLTNILTQKNKFRLLNTTLSVFAGLFFVYLGVIYRFSLTSIVFYVGSYFIFLFFILFRRVKHILNIILVFSILSGYAFVLQNNFSWSTTVSEQYFNIYKTDYTKIKEKISYPLTKRPERVFIDTPPLNPDQYKNDQRYNKFWLTGEFGALGYHNIKDIDAYRKLFPRLEKNNDPLIKFLSSEGQQLAIIDEINISTSLIDCVNQKKCINNSGITILQLQFAKESEKFSIKSTSNFVMVQNEMYSNVWNGKICDSSGKCTLIKSRPILDSLRAWDLPKGEYVFETYAKTPLDDLRWIFFKLGLSLSIFFITLTVYQSRTRIKSNSRSI